eukprot:Hpha_TRINITY_DN15493_c1_g1::TRINITY_DN15493_c1_g1_i4::g.173659::m.173659
MAEDESASAPDLISPSMPPAATSPSIPALQNSPPVEPDQEPGQVEALPEATANVVRAPGPVVEHVNVILNGVQALRCELPEKKDGEKTTTAEDIPGRVLHVMGGGFRSPVHLVASAPSLLLGRDEHLELRVRFTDGGSQAHELVLGELHGRMDSLCLVETLPFAPARLEVTVLCHAQTAADGTEAALVETLRDILADEEVNPRGGSIPASTAEDLLRKRAAEMFEEVALSGCGGLEGFLKKHEDVFTYFTFSDRALKKKTVSPEPRIVLKPGQRELCTKIPMTAAEKRLFDYLEQILGREDIDKRDLLDLLSNDTGFATFLSPTLSILMRFLSRHKDVFVWSMDPDKPTVVGLQGRQHDSASLGQQASLDKQLALPKPKFTAQGAEDVSGEQPPPAEGDEAVEGEKENKEEGRSPTSEQPTAPKQPVQSQRTPLQQQPTQQGQPRSKGQYHQQQAQHQHHHHQSHGASPRGGWQPQRGGKRGGFQGGRYDHGGRFDGGGRYDHGNRYPDARFQDARFADARFADARFADARFADARFDQRRGYDAGARYGGWSG